MFDNRNKTPATTAEASSLSTHLVGLQCSVQARRLKPASLHWQSQASAGQWWEPPVNHMMMILTWLHDDDNAMMMTMIWRWQRHDDDYDSITKSDTLLEEELELLLELESKLELLDDLLESKADELESKEELKPDPPKPEPPELNPDPPELNPDPLEPRLAKLVGGALLEERGRPRVEVDPKSKLDESRVDPKELWLCWAESKLAESKLEDSKLEKPWFEPKFSWAKLEESKPPWMDTLSPEPCGRKEFESHWQTNQFFVTDLLTDWPLSKLTKQYWDSILSSFSFLKGWSALQLLSDCHEGVSDTLWYIYCQTGFGAAWFAMAWNSIEQCGME